MSPVDSATVSKLSAIFGRYGMAKIHFPSMKALQNKDDVIHRFDDRDFVLSVFTYVFHPKIRLFRSYSRFSFVKERRKSISGRWKHRTSKVTSPFNFWLVVYLFTLPEFSIYLVPFKSYSRVSCLCNG
jgi:ribonucleotide reductase alpha subunit